MISVVKFERMGNGRYTAVFDTGITCRLYHSEAAFFHLEEGAQLTEEIYHQLLFDVVGKRAKKRALFLLEQMDRSEKKLREKLEGDGYPACCVESAVTYVKKFHYLDDHRFACTYIRYHQDKMSRQQLIQKLMQKGISSTVAKDAAEEEYTSDERIQIRTLLEKRHYDPECDPKEFNRTVSFLLRRGFSSGDILREMKREMQS